MNARFDEALAASTWRSDTSTGLRCRCKGRILRFGRIRTSNCTPTEKSVCGAASLSVEYAPLNAMQKLPWGVKRMRCIVSLTRAIF